MIQFLDMIMSCPLIAYSLFLLNVKDIRGFTGITVDSM